MGKKHKNKNKLDKVLILMAGQIYIQKKVWKVMINKPENIYKMTKLYKNKVIEFYIGLVLVGEL